MSEHNFSDESEARTARRQMIDLGIPVSLLAFDPSRDLYGFDAWPERN